MVFPLKGDAWLIVKKKKNAFQALKIYYGSMVLNFN